jgi:hypothetical protein
MSFAQRPTIMDRLAQGLGPIKTAVFLTPLDHVFPVQALVGPFLLFPV